MYATHQSQGMKLNYGLDTAGKRDRNTQALLKYYLRKKNSLKSQPKLYFNELEKKNQNKPNQEIRQSKK